MKIFCFNECHNDDISCDKMRNMHLDMIEKRNKELADCRRVINEHSTTITELTCKWKNEKQLLDHEIIELNNQIYELKNQINGDKPQVTCFEGCDGKDSGIEQTCCKEESKEEGKIHKPTYYLSSQRLPPDGAPNKRKYDKRKK